FFICLAALLLGILNTLSAFFIPAVAPASLSIAEIGFIMGIAPALSPDNQIKGLAISVIVGGIGQFLVQWPKICALGWHLRWKLKFSHPGLKQIGTLMIPSMIGLSVDQINAFVDTMAASFLELGSITALYYSNRVMQLPLAIFGLALASVALPAMSRAAAEKNMESLKETLNFSVRFILFILIPSAVGLMVLGMPIIHVLFERGNFSHQAALMTNSALFFYSFGLPAYAIAKVMAIAFYSQKETKIPVQVAAAAMVLNVVLILILMPYLKVGGLALATALASYFNFSVLAWLLRKRIGPLGIRRILQTATKTMIAATVMGLVSYFIAFRWLVDYPAGGMVLALVGGMAVFFGTAYVMKLEELTPVLSMVFKDKPTGGD
ncbi:MAG: murein biosynthesis integral membrane protein MurJ, partial [Elusimicrobiota bacterium]